MFRKRQLSIPAEKSNGERWDNAIDQIDSNAIKRNRRLTQNEFISPCIELARCLILSARGMGSDKIKKVHVAYFIDYTQNVIQFLMGRSREVLNPELNLALFDCLYDLYCALLLKSDKSAAEILLQHQLKEGLDNLKLFVNAARLKSFELPKDEAPARIVAMRSHILQQPLNVVIDEFFLAFAPENNLHDIAINRQRTFKRIKLGSIENDTANLQITYSDSTVAKLLSKIPELLSDSAQFKSGIQHLSRLKNHLQEFTAIELAQFYFLSARAAFMSGSTKMAIDYFKDALNVSGTHIGHHFTITANLLCAIQQYALEVSNAQEVALVKESISLKASAPKQKMLTHFLRRDQRIALLSDIPTETACRLFQPKQNPGQQRSKRCTTQDRLEILKINITHYVNAAFFVCNSSVPVINSFVDSVINVTSLENKRQARLV